MILGIWALFRFTRFGLHARATMQDPTMARALGVILFILMTAPVAAHVIGRAGYFVGARLWGGTVKDELKPNYDPLTHELKSGMETEDNARRESGGADGS